MKYCYNNLKAFFRFIAIELIFESDITSTSRLKLRFAYQILLLLGIYNILPMNHNENFVEIDAKNDNLEIVLIENLKNHLKHIII